MHEDLERLDRIDRWDRERARLARTKAGRETELADAKTAVDETAAALATAEGVLAENREAQLTLQRSLAEHQRNRDSATRLLETGQGNPEAAERQVARCEALIDEVETDILELLEAQDGLADTRAAADAAAQAAVATRDRLATEVPEATAALDAQMRSVSAERDALFSELPGHTQRRYSDFRARGKWAVSRMSGHACDACQMELPAQQRGDLRRGLIEPCRRCHRWVIPPLEAVAEATGK